MGNKSRIPMQVAPEFETRIKNLQKAIMIEMGEKVSMRDLTEKISKTPSFDDLERSLLNVGNVDLKLNFDKRGRK